ncbi:MAG: cysteine desulfurase family protein [bacterium]
MEPIYLDHNATTPIDPGVIDAMAETARRFWANPSSGHPPGLAAREELAKRRSVIARFIGAKPEEIIFTSGGTESDNLAVFGAARANQNKGRHLLISSIEHHAVLESCKVLSGQGFDVSHLPVDRDGRVDPDDVKKELRKDTVLVSVMHANNEVGTVQPIAEIGRLVRERGVLFHTDAAQSVGKLPIHVDELCVDLLTCSSHKIYGPKGVGFLYVRAGTNLSPLSYGGAQEGGFRSGTENLPGIAGLANALETAEKGMQKEGSLLAQLRDALFEALSRSLDGIDLNGHMTSRLPGTLSLSVQGVKSSDLITLLSQKGVFVSASAACTTASIHPSHVLSAMGISPSRAAGTLRISLGRSTRKEDLPYIADVLSSSVKQMRRRPS